MIALSKLREDLGLPMEQDDKLQAILDGMVASWEDRTKRLWKRRAGYVEYFRFTKRLYTLFLGLWPVETITKVEVKALAETTWTELTADEFVLVDPLRNRVERIGCPWSEQVRITYSGGYTEAPISGQYGTPQDVQDVLILQERFVRQRTTASNLITSSQNFQGGAGVYLRSDFHPLYQAAIEEKKRKV